MYSYLLLVATAMATARRGKNGRKRTVFIQTVQKRHDDRQSATAEEAFAENPVFRAENEKRNEDPKGSISL